MKDAAIANGSDLSLRSSGASFARKIFSYPVVLGTLLLVGTFAGRYLNIYESVSHSGSFSNIPFEGDTWWHLMVGGRILSTSHWPITDTYSFTGHGAPFIASEWLGSVLMAAASRVAGIEGLMGLLLLMSGVFVLLLYYYAYQRCGNAMPAFLACAALIPLVSYFFTLRPQMLGYAFLVLTLIALEKFRHGREKALWLLPWLFIVWVNTHGNLIFGFFVIGMYWAVGLRAFQFKYVRGEQWTARQRRHLELIFLLCLLASLINPYGSRLAAYPLEMVLFRSTNIRTNTEFLPLHLTGFEGMLFLFLIAVFLVYVATSRRALSAQDVVLFLVATFEALAHTRFILFFAPIFVALLAQAINYWVPAPHRAQDRHWANAILILAAIALAAVFLPSKRTIQRAIANNFPAAAVDYIAQHDVPGPMFNELSWGGYLTWSLSPEHQVFIDSRDIYDYAGVIQDYIRIVDGGPHTFYLLGKYNVRSCLISPDTRLASSLAASPGWREIYRDRMSVIYVKAGKR